MSSQTEGNFSGGRIYVLVALTLVYTLNFLDRQLLAILAEPIKLDLGLSDTMLGLLTGFAFALFYTAFGLPLAWLADRWNRVAIISMSCAVWSGFTALCGLAQSPLQLALARIGVGVGEAGGTPPSYSILADHYHPHERSRVYALYSMGVPAGLVLGAVLGGWITNTLGWRYAFMVVGSIGIAMACILALTVKEPPRGRLDQASETPEATMSLWAAGRLFVQDRTLAWTAGGASLSAFVGYGLLNWTPAFLMREQGMPVEAITLNYSLVIGISMALGIWIGGELPDRLNRFGLQSYALVPMGAFLVVIPFLVSALLAESWQLSLVLMAVPGAMYMVYLAPALAILQNTVPAAARAQCSAILLLAINIVGLGLGPLFVGVVSDQLSLAGIDDSLRWAMLGLAPFSLLTALVHFGTARTLRKAQTTAPA